MASLVYQNISIKCVVTVFIGITFGFGFAYLLLEVLTIDIISPLSHTPCCNEKTVGGTAAPKNYTSFYESFETHNKDELVQNVRVLCWIMTNPDNHDTKAKAVKETWGRRCDILLFVSTQVDENLPTVVVDVEEGYQTLWGKTKKGFAHAYENYLDEADWFMKADDDTYVVIENLRYVLLTHSPDEPVYFGRKFRKYGGEEAYMSGGAGYVLSREALKRFVEIALTNSEVCRTEDDEGPEDLEMGKCMANVGVVSGDSRDSTGRGRFFPFQPEYHLIPGYLDGTLWFWEYTNTSSTEGADCCSDTAISFHYIQPKTMYVLDYVIYHLHPFGTQIKPMEIRPPRYQPLPPNADSFEQQSNENNSPENSPEVTENPNTYL